MAEEVIVLVLGLIAQELKIRVRVAEVTGGL